MSEQELVLSVRHVTSGYRSGGLLRRGPYQEVLHDVTFDVRHGEILGLVGESGTGKSTLAKTILGIVKPDRGQVIHYTKRPQMIFQDPYSAQNREGDLIAQAAQGSPDGGGHKSLPSIHPLPVPPGQQEGRQQDQVRQQPDVQFSMGSQKCHAHSAAASSCLV